MNVSKASELLNLAKGEGQRLRRHLLAAAAIREICSVEPIVVGGTAEEYWTADEYHPTDLDMCAPLGPEEKRALKEIGFSRDRGERHWYHEGAKVAVEFPASKIDGELSRVHHEEIDGGVAAIIGLDDLYLDRLRQSTITDIEGTIEFHSALAVAAARYETIDWEYVRSRISEISKKDSGLAEAMKSRNSRIRRRARRTLSEA